MLRKHLNDIFYISAEEGTRGGICFCVDKVFQFFNMGEKKFSLKIGSHDEDLEVAGRILILTSVHEDFIGVIAESNRESVAFIVIHNIDSFDNYVVNESAYL